MAPGRALYSALKDLRDLAAVATATTTAAKAQVKRVQGPTVAKVTHRLPCAGATRCVPQPEGGGTFTGRRKGRC